MPLSLSPDVLGCGRRIIRLTASFFFLSLRPRRVRNRRNRERRGGLSLLRRRRRRRRARGRLCRVPAVRQRRRGRQRRDLRRRPRELRRDAHQHHSKALWRREFWGRAVGPEQERERAAGGDVPGPRGGARPKREPLPVDAPAGSEAAAGPIRVEPPAEPRHRGYDFAIQARVRRVRRVGHGEPTRNVGANGTAGAAVPRCVPCRGATFISDWARAGNASNGNKKSHQRATSCPMLLLSRRHPIQK